MDQASLEALPDEELLKSFYANAVECTIRSKQIKVLVSDSYDGIKLSKEVLKGLNKTSRRDWSSLIRHAYLDTRTNPVLIEYVERFQTRAFVRGYGGSVIAVDVPLGHTIIIDNHEGLETTKVVPLYLV